MWPGLVGTLKQFIEMEYSGTNFVMGIRDLLGSAIKEGLKYEGVDVYTNVILTSATV
jgi:hypothetical protein